MQAFSGLIPCCLPRQAVPDAALSAGGQAAGGGTAHRRSSVRPWGSSALFQGPPSFQPTTSGGRGGLKSQLRGYRSLGPCTNSHPDTLTSEEDTGHCSEQ